MATTKKTTTDQKKTPEQAKQPSGVSSFLGKISQGTSALASGIAKGVSAVKETAKKAPEIVATVKKKAAPVKAALDQAMVGQKTEEFKKKSATQTAPWAITQQALSQQPLPSYLEQGATVKAKDKATLTERAGGKDTQWFTEKRDKILGKLQGYFPDQKKREEFAANVVAGDNPSAVEQALAPYNDAQRRAITESITNEQTLSSKMGLVGLKDKVQSKLDEDEANKPLTRGSYKVLTDDLKWTGLQASKGVLGAVKSFIDSADQFGRGAVGLLDGPDSKQLSYQDRDTKKKEYNWQDTGGKEPTQDEKKRGYAEYLASRQLSSQDPGILEHASDAFMGFGGVAGNVFAPGSTAAFSAAQEYDVTRPLLEKADTAAKYIGFAVDYIPGLKDLPPEKRDELKSTLGRGVIGLVLGTKNKGNVRKNPKQFAMENLTFNAIGRNMADAFLGIPEHFFPEGKPTIGDVKAATRKASQNYDISGPEPKLSPERQRKNVVLEQAMKRFREDTPTLFKLFSDKDSSVSKHTESSVLKTDTGEPMVFHKTEQGFIPANPDTPSTQTAVINSENPYRITEEQFNENPQVILKEAEKQGFDLVKVDAEQDLYIPLKEESIKVVQVTKMPEMVTRESIETKTLDDVLADMKEPDASPRDPLQITEGSTVLLKNGNTAVVTDISVDGKLSLTERVISGKKEAVWKSTEANMDSVSNTTDGDTEIVDSVGDNYVGMSGRLKNGDFFYVGSFYEDPLLGEQVIGIVGVPKSGKPYIKKLEPNEFDSFMDISQYEKETRLKTKALKDFWIKNAPEELSRGSVLADSLDGMYDVEEIETLKVENPGKDPSTFQRNGLRKKSGEVFDFYLPSNEGKRRYSDRDSQNKSFTALKYNTQTRYGPFSTPFSTYEPRKKSSDPAYDVAQKFNSSAIDTVNIIAKKPVVLTPKQFAKMKLEMAMNKETWHGYVDRLRSAGYDSVVVRKINERKKTHVDTYYVLDQSQVYHKERTLYATETPQKPQEVSGVDDTTLSSDIDNLILDTFVQKPKKGEPLPQRLINKLFKEKNIDDVIKEQPTPKKVVEEKYYTEEGDKIVETTKEKVEDAKKTAIDKSKNITERSQLKSLSDKIGTQAHVLYSLDKKMEKTRKGTGFTEDFTDFYLKQETIKKQNFDMLNARELERRSKMTLLQRNIEGATDFVKKKILRQKPKRHPLVAADSGVKIVDLMKRSAKKGEKPKGILSLMEDTQREGGKFAESYKGLGEVKDVVKAALRNGDVEMIKKLEADHGIEVPRELLDKMRKEANDAGIPVPYRADYFPSLCIDPKGFNAFMKQTLGADVYKELFQVNGLDPNKMPDDVQQKYLEDFARNTYGLDGRKLELGNLLRRKYDVIPAEALKFFADPDVAMDHYVKNVSKGIAVKKFLNKGNEGVNFDTGERIHDDIDSYLMRKMAEGALKPDDYKKAETVLRNVLGDYGKRKGWVSGYQGLHAMTTIFNPITAIGNIADVIRNVFDNGVKNALSEYGSVFYREAMLKPFSVLDINEYPGAKKFLKKLGLDPKTDRLSLDMLGFGDIQGELHKDVLGSIGNMAASLSGFTKVQRIGEQAYVNATVRSLEDLATGKSDRAKWQMRDNLGWDDARIERLKKDILNGTISDDYKLFVAHQWNRAYAKTKLQRPGAYSRNPNMNIMYHLKTLMITNMDWIRRDGFSTMEHGIKAVIRGEKEEGWRLFRKGAAAILGIAMLQMMAAATTGEMKDFVLGRGTTLKDRGAEILWSLALITNKYTYYQFKMNGTIGGLRAAFGIPTLGSYTFQDYGNRLEEGGEYESFPEYALNKGWTAYQAPILGKLISHGFFGGMPPEGEKWTYDKFKDSVVGEATYLKHPIPPEEEIIAKYKDYLAWDGWDQYDWPAGVKSAQHFDPKWYPGTAGSDKDLKDTKQRVKSSKWYDKSLRETVSQVAPFIARSRHGEKVMVAEINRYIDGDTIELKARDATGKPIKVRLLGIDTPETKKEGVDPQFKGAEASAKTKAMAVPGRTIRLRSDVVNSLTDDYGRITAYVEVLPKEVSRVYSIPWLKKRVPAEDYNKSMITESLARYTRMYPLTREEEYLTAARAQEKLGVGVYDKAGREAFNKEHGYDPKSESASNTPRYGSYDDQEFAREQHEYKQEGKYQKKYGKDTQTSGGDWASDAETSSPKAISWSNDWASDAEPDAPSGTYTPAESR